MKRLTFRWLMAVAATAGLYGCANPRPPLPPSLELPQAVTDLRAARKGDLVTLTWTVPTRTVDRQNIRHMGTTRICRAAGSKIAECDHPAGEVSASQFPVTLPEKKPKQKPPKVEANFTDTLPREMQPLDPTAVITYAVSVFNTHERTAGLSNLVQVPAVPTLPPPANFHAQVTADGVVLTWSAVPAPPETPGLSYRIRINRRGDTDKGDLVAGEVPLDATTFTDRGFEWDKTYTYHATVLTEIAQPGRGETLLEGEDTPVVKVFAHDVFPPAVPVGVEAVATGVGQQPGIDLVWAPDTEPDLAGYNIYRHEEGGVAVKINRDPVTTPSFRDVAVLSGHKYFYSVSAVDVRGNESARSEEAQETAP